MKDLLEIVEKIAELLYQERKDEAYGILIKCIPIMATCFNEIEDVALQQEMIVSLNDAVGAMENNDYTLLADILQYDIIEKLKEIGEE